MKLHPELGVNPKLTICPRCGGEGDELVLIGNHTGVFKCPACSGEVRGGKPLSGICPLCTVVADGGVYWRCRDCKAEGVIKKNEFTEKVRRYYELYNGEPCGVELTKENCPV